MRRFGTRDSGMMITLYEKVSHSGLTPLFGVTLIQTMRFSSKLYSKVIKGIPKPPHTKISSTKIPPTETLPKSHIPNLLTTKPPYTKSSSYQNPSYQNLLMPKFPHTKTSLY